MKKQKPKFSLKTSLEEREKQLLEMADEEIDYSDIPPLDESLFDKAKPANPQKNEPAEHLLPG